MTDVFGCTIIQYEKKQKAKAEKEAAEEEARRKLTSAANFANAEGKKNNFIYSNSAS